MRNWHFTIAILLFAISVIADEKLSRSGWRSDFETYVPYILQGTKDLTNQERAERIKQNFFGQTVQNDQSNVYFAFVFDGTEDERDHVWSDNQNQDTSEISSEYVRVEATITNGPKVIAIGLELNRAISTKRKPKWSHIMFDMSKDHKDFDKKPEKCENSNGLKRLWMEYLQSNTNRNPYFALTVCDEIEGNDLDLGVSIFGQPHVMQGRKSDPKIIQLRLFSV